MYPLIELFWWEQFEKFVDNFNYIKSYTKRKYYLIIIDNVDH